MSNPDRIQEYFVWQPPSIMVLLKIDLPNNICQGSDQDWFRIWYGQKKIPNLTGLGISNNLISPTSSSNEFRQCTHSLC
jgi:hypothetical protein